MTTSKLQQAVIAIKSGNKKTGYRLLVETIKANPRGKEAEVAWLWMATVVSEPQKKQQCLETVLKLNPDNEKARKGLRSLSLSRTVSMEEPDINEMVSSSPVAPAPQIGKDSAAKDSPTPASSQSSTSDEALIQQYVAKLTRQGWQVVSQTDSSAQLRKPKQWSRLLLLLGAILLLFAGVGLVFWLLALIDYVIKKERIIFVTADALRAGKAKKPASTWSSPVTVAGILLGLFLACIVATLFFGSLAASLGGRSNSSAVENNSLPPTYTPLSNQSQHHTVEYRAGNATHARIHYRTASGDIVTLQSQSLPWQKRVQVRDDTFVDVEVISLDPGYDPNLGINDATCQILVDGRVVVDDEYYCEYRVDD